MISVIIPFYNEKENLPVLLTKLIQVLKKIDNAWEVILVNDGSNDQFEETLNKFKELKAYQKNGYIKLINHQKRLGKGYALKSGIENSNGQIIVFMDADLQDDPEDLPKFLEKINKGYDFVNGVRVLRQDNFLIKFYSSLARYFLKVFLHSPFDDINCGFKAFKRRVLEGFNFYGNNFRFFPLAVYYQGYQVGQVSVKNNPRLFGKSKFGIQKIFFGIFDVLTAYFIFKFSEKPLHFFGIIGGSISFLGFLILVYLAYERIFHNQLLYRRPILWLGILFVIVGIQIINTGIIGELIVYVNKNKKIKKI